MRVFIEADAPRVELPRPWGDGGRGAVGSPRRRAHPSVRRSGRLAGHPHVEVGGGRVDAGRLAHRGGDRQPGRGRCPHGAGSVRRAGADRDRRDLLPAWPQVLDGRRRSRLGSAGVGGGRSRPGHPAEVLRSPRPATSQSYQADQRRRRRVDRRHARWPPARTRRCAWTRFTSSGGAPKPSTWSAGGCGTCCAGWTCPATPSS